MSQIKIKLIILSISIITSCAPLPPVSTVPDYAPQWSPGLTKSFQPTKQSNPTIDIYDFLSGVNAIRVNVWSKEMQEQLDNNTASAAISIIFKQIQEYLWKLGFEYVAITSSDKAELSNIPYSCSVANFAFGYEFENSWLKNCWFSFQNCKGDYWNFQIPGTIYDNPYNNKETAIAFVNKMKKMFYHNVKRDTTYTLRLDKEMTEWNEQKIKSHFDANRVKGLEGIYERLKYGQENSVTMAKYKIGVISNNEGYDIIYLDGATNSSDWTEGELKAKIFKTASPNFYKVEWLMSHKVKNDDVYAFVGDETGLLTFQFPDEKDRNTKSEYLKLYPTINTPTNPSSGTPYTDSFRGSGSGFVVSEDGIIVTNYHVIDGAEIVKVQVTQVGNNNMYSADIILSDPKNDLAILKINDNSFKSFDKIPYAIKKQVSDMGTKVYALGYPLIDTMGESIKLTDGIISSKMGYQGDITQYQLSVPVQPGNSGGPLFDKQGYLVGVINAKHRDADNATYAIKSNVLANLLELVPNPPDLDKKNTLVNLSLAKQAAIIEDFVLLIKVK